MKRTDTGLVYSPTDLWIFQGSPFASWMDRLYLEDKKAATPDVDTAETAAIMRRGLEHEAGVLKALRAEGLRVSEIPQGSGEQAATLEAMRDGPDVIFQAALSMEGFAGYADFLVKVPGPSTLGAHHYEAWDAKLTHKAKPTHVIQLCCYAEMLESIQGVRPQELCIVLGTEQRWRFRTADYFYYYLKLKERFLELMRDWRRDDPPAPGSGENLLRWKSEAQSYLERSDHLLRVANIRGSQIKRLKAVGIRSRGDLAHTKLERVPKLNTETFAKLRRQAQLQLASDGSEVPGYEVLTPSADKPRSGLALLPPPSRNDIFFDMEGYPLVEGGLEYLFGVTLKAKNGKRAYRDWWAHDREQERTAFRDFVDWVYDRWTDDPSMHIYHYAHYEPTALKRLMGTHGTREEKIDQLLRGEVFVDLYAVVRQGLVIGAPGYSIKDVELLYRGKREGEVGTAGESIGAYDQWIESGEAGEVDKSPLLEAIRDYNRDDCESTEELVRWLRKRQGEHVIAWVPPEAAEPKDVTDEDEHPTIRGLLDRAALGPDTRDTDELLAHLIHFHKRENKPTWWFLFDRRTWSEEQLIDDIACLGGLELESSEHGPKKSTHTYRFEPGQETKMRPGARCYFAHDDVKVKLEALDLLAGKAVISISHAGLARAGGEMPRRLSLSPDDFVSPKPIPGAIEAVADRWLEEQVLPPALGTLLGRDSPSIDGQNGGPVLQAAESAHEGALRVIENLQNSLLCIQGPPGTGKTWTAAHAILRLVDDGRTVGVTSNSHKAILNLLDACMKLRGGELDCAERGNGDDPFFTRWPRAQAVAAADLAGIVDDVRLVGGTAWAFSRGDMVETLDYLFVDEAGQVSLANLVGMSRAAKNVVLIGDQMQLPQPMQGSHPGESGTSSLEYFLGDHATVPDDLGVFLDTTYRMHPEIGDFISDAVYEGRVRSAPKCSERVVRLPKGGGARVTREAGIVFVPVEHEGNTQGSDEEAAVVVQVVDELLKRRLTGEDGEVTGRVKHKDILVVAPYNLQVRKLAAALPKTIRVGTVDKFQGQEAPIVIISMCASDGDESPRGIEFLFNQNRLNVALSRAQSLSIVVGNPRLALTRCTTVKQMALVNLYCRILGEGVGQEQHSAEV